MRSKIKPLYALILSFMLVACAPATQHGEVHDPLEPFNRAMFSFNEVVDNLVLRPLAQGYRFIAPKPVRRGVSNFISNLSEPVVFVNSVLQADAQNAFTAFWRLMLNTFLGFGGFYDFAGTYGNLPHRSEDFGQTLGVWGVDNGPYLVLPIIGPTSGRDALGRVADGFMDPFNYYISSGHVADNSNRWIYVRYGVTAITAREDVLDLTDQIYSTSFDPYATFRSAYIQRRKAQVQNRNAGKNPSLEMY